MDQGVEQCIPHSLGRVTPDVHPIQSGELRLGAVESVDIAVGVFRLLEQRGARFLLALECRFFAALEDRQFGGVAALV